MEVKNMAIAFQNGSSVFDLDRTAYDMYELFEFFYEICEVNNLLTQEQHSVLFGRLFRRYIRRGEEEQILLEVIEILEKNLDMHKYKDMEFARNFLEKLKWSLKRETDGVILHICLFEAPFTWLLGDYVPFEDYDNLTEEDAPFWQRPDYVLEKYFGGHQPEKVILDGNKIMQKKT